MKVADWKPFQKNTLRGFFTIICDSGLVLHKCTLHQKDGSRWIGLPAEKYQKRDGTTGYSALVEFSTRDAADKFRDQALRAFDAC